MKGRPVQACDRCAKRIISCDSENPCENCQISRVSCTYLRVRRKSVDADHVNEPISDLISPSLVGGHKKSKENLALGKKSVFFNTSVVEKLKNSIPFLLNWFDAENGITRKFGRIEDGLETETEKIDRFALHQTNTAFYPPVPGQGYRSMEASTQDKRCTVTAASLTTFTPELELWDDYILDTSRSYDALLAPPSIESSESLSSSVLLQGGLADRDISMELSELLTAVCVSLPYDHPETAPNKKLADGLAMLTPPNIDLFIQLYFLHWNRHSPTLHPSSFQTCTMTCLPLVLVVALTGALFSSQPRHAGIARGMLDITEEVVFKDENFCNLVAGVTPTGLDQQRAGLEILQSAFAIIQLQMHEGSRSKRRSVRKGAFDKLVYVSLPINLLIYLANNMFSKASRAMSLNSITIDYYGEALGVEHLAQTFDWIRFGETEAKIRYANIIKMKESNTNSNEA